MESKGIVCRDDQGGLRMALVIGHDQDDRGVQVLALCNGAVDDIKAVRTICAAVSELYADSSSTYRVSVDAREFKAIQSLVLQFSVGYLSI